MGSTMNLPIAIFFAYALGCVSFASVISRLRGVDIRAAGSGNPGATNVGRVIGKPWGILVLALDVAKGWLPAWLLSEGAGLTLSPLVVDGDGRTLVVLAAVLGHVCPVTARFRGGKGVATLIGGCLALDPRLALIAIVCHVVVKRGLGFVSLASVALVWCIPVTQLSVTMLRAAPSGADGLRVDGAGVMGLLALLVTVLHRDNLARIRARTEERYDDPETPEQVRNA